VGLQKNQGGMNMTMRKGLGLHKGMGYRNIIPRYDSHRHSLNAKGYKMPQRMPMMCGGKREPIGDVWKLETPSQDYAADDLWHIEDAAMKGDRKAQNYLKKLWDNEKWDSIKKKLQTEGSVWYVWHMDGVNQHLMNMQKGGKRQKAIERWLEKQDMEQAKDKKLRLPEIPVDDEQGGKGGGKAYQFHVGKKLVSIIYKKGGNGIVAYYKVDGKIAKDRQGRVKEYSWANDIDNLAYTIEKDIRGGKCSPSDLKYGTAPDSQFDAKALKAGMKVESEHTDSKPLQKAITKAHLKESGDYYTKLKKMEKGGKITHLKTKVVEGNLRNYNEMKAKGYFVLDSGDGMMRFAKKANGGKGITIDYKKVHYGSKEWEALKRKQEENKGKIEKWRAATDNTFYKVKRGNLYVGDKKLFKREGWGIGKGMTYYYVKDGKYPRNISDNKGFLEGHLKEIMKPHKIPSLPRG
jgi:hypothetical protein